MSEQTEREIEIVAGTIGGITQKKADTWTVAVTPEGSQYSKNLWTKDVELVESLSTKIGQAGAFVCSASYWKHPEKGQVRSLWIQGEGTPDDIQNAQTHESVRNPPERVATPAAAPSSDGMSKEEWRRKDSAADKRALTAIAVSALSHTMPSDPSTEDLGKFLGRVAHLVTAWHRSIEAERDGEEPPF